MQSIYPPVSEKDQEQDRYIGWFLTTFSLVLMVSMAAAFLFAFSAFPTGYKGFEAPNFVTFMGLSLLVGAAGFAVGGFIGFLFGVPRMRTSEGEHDTRRAGTSQVVSNTNLEQLSDWLTKILVGVGLVQIHEVDPLLSRFRDQIDHALTAPDGHRLAGAGFAACMILIGSTVAGFLAAYLKSKTDLMRAFREPIDMVQSALGGVAQKLIVDAARTVLDRPSSVPDNCSKDTAAKLVQFVPPNSDDPELYQLVGLAHAVLKNFKPAAESLKMAIDLRQKKGMDADLTLNAFATRALAIAGDVDVAKAISATTLPAGVISSDEVENALAAMFAQLYSRGGYDAAIEIGTRLTKDSEARKSGRLMLYLACAWGQRHAALVAQKTMQAGDRDAAQALSGEIDHARDQALAATRDAIQLDREKNEPVLRQLWDPAAPGKPPSENDLESLHGDPAFMALLRAGPMPAPPPPPPRATPATAPPPASDPSTA
ncbi:hypothetical protein [Sphingomonas profundi]|uniref:hypothetical protein n=1 Tax=Alterirhizorhabdus profundi TaxID=2681549 RepID=UPI0012E83536|nr:hypothetical protein [Sphingomonas profundi]